MVEIDFEVIVRRDCRRSQVFKAGAAAVGRKRAFTYRQQILRYTYYWLTWTRKFESWVRLGNLGK